MTQTDQLLDVSYFFPLSASGSLIWHHFSFREGSSAFRNQEGEEKKTDADRKTTSCTFFRFCLLDCIGVIFWKSFLAQNEELWQLQTFQLSFIVHFALRQKQLHFSLFLFPGSENRVTLSAATRFSLFERHPVC